MREYSHEMNQRALEAKEQATREAQSATIPILPNSSMPQIPIPSNTTVNPMPDISSSSSIQPTRRVDPAVALDDEEGKRNLISNEIQMFRDRFKDEDTKMRNTEKERKDRYERERALQREKRAAEETPTSGNNKSAVSPSHVIHHHHHHLVIVHHQDVIIIVVVQVDVIVHHLMMIVIVVHHQEIIQVILYVVVQ